MGKINILDRFPELTEAGKALLKSTAHPSLRLDSDTETYRRWLYRYLGARELIAPWIVEALRSNGYIEPALDEGAMVEAVEELLDRCEEVTSEMEATSEMED